MDQNYPAQFRHHRPCGYYADDGFGNLMWNEDDQFLQALAFWDLNTLDPL